MRDEDLVEVMAEFEGNVAAADTHLAIKREGLRKLWLQKVVKRRKMS
jgi:DNA-binding protein Fis